MSQVDTRRSAAAALTGLVAMTVVACGGAPPSLPPAPAETPTSSAERPEPAVEQQFASEPIPYVFRDPERMQRIEQALPLIDPLIEAELTAQDLVGVSFGLIVDGELVYAKGYGSTHVDADSPPTPDTVYRIGSITKSFTALALLDLRDKGKLSLDDTLAQHVPEAGTIVYPTRDSKPITLRQVLTHKSGLPRSGNLVYAEPGSEPTEQEVLESLRGVSLQHSPDEAFQYSNFGFALLGLVVQRVSNQRYRDVVTKELFEPLGMESTVWDPEDVPAGRRAPAYRKKDGERVEVPPWRLGASESAGGIYSSVRDMAHYVAFELAAYPPRSDKDDGPVARASVRESHASALRAGRLSVKRRYQPDRPPLSARISAYGYGWGVSQNCAFGVILGHNGGTEGFSSNVEMLPEYGIGAVAFTNAAHADLGAVTARILQGLVDRAELSKREAEPSMASRPFAPAMSRLLGVYETWDEEAYGAMLSEGRPRIASEKEELAGYKRLHGSCSGYELIDAKRPRAASFALTCERGELEMRVSIGNKDGLITGFTGISRGVDAPAPAKRAAGDVVRLIDRWNPATYRAGWQTKPGTDDSGASAFFDKVRARAGACTVDAYLRRGDSDEFVLKCERGGDLVLNFTLDQDTSDKIRRYTVRPAPSSAACPAVL